MFFFILILSIICAYFIGSVSFAIILTERKLHKDIREFGSGNAGGTNAMRVLGKKTGVFVMILDMLKGAVSILLPMLLFYLAGFGKINDFYLALIGLFAVLGHLFPIYYGFKGGKGIAATAGITFVLSPLAFVLLLGVWALCVILSKYVSLGSIAISILLAPVYFLFEGVILQKAEAPFTAIVLAVTGLILVATHIPNIKRLLKGRENKIGSKKE